MKPIEPPETIKVYQLLKRTGVALTPVGSSTTTSFGVGFFQSQQDAEMFRTMELLKMSSTDNSEFFVFELELPNPVYKGKK